MDFDSLLDTFVVALVKLLVIVIPILFAALTGALVQYLNEHRAKLKKQGRIEEVYLLQEFTSLAMFAAEQLFDSNSEKLDFACGELIRVANENGIALSHQDAKLLIEGTLKDVKREMRGLKYHGRQ